jgi:flagellar hook-basal body complex protein FliE
MQIASALAAQNYALSRPATQPSGADGGSLFTSAAAEFAATLREGEQTAIAAMQGEADPHSLVAALSQAELAVETAVTLRNRVVEAYQEILRMPV